MSQENDKQIEIAQIEAKIRELTEVSRIVANTLNLIADMDIKGAHVEPVLEIVNYNRGFKTKVDQQIETFKSMLPKKEVAPVPAISPLAEVK